MSIERMQRLLLLVMAIGLIPIALSNGLAPHISMPFLFGFEVGVTNLQNIFRAISGLYFAMIVFWIMGAKRDHLRLHALWSLHIFVLGIGLGRVVSILVDGWPSSLLFLYTILELLLAATSWVLIQKSPETEHMPN